MKMLRVSVVLLVSILFQVHGTPNMKSKMIGNKGIMQDVETAMENLKSLSSECLMMTNADLYVSEYFNHLGVNNNKLLYKTLLDFKIQESDVIDLRLQHDNAVLDISQSIATAMQHNRDLEESSDVAWLHLDSFNLDSLNDNVASIQSTYKVVQTDTLDLQRKIEDMHSDMTASVNILKAPLTVLQQKKINSILATMTGDIDTINGILLFRGTELLDATNAAVKSLQTIIEELNPKKL